MLWIIICLIKYYHPAFGNTSLFLEVVARIPKVNLSLIEGVGLLL